MNLKPEETIDELRPVGRRILQSKRGYRFSLDPVLLCAFARGGEGRMVADLGTGAGVIPLLLSGRPGIRRIVGVEIQPQLADRARRSIALNDLSETVEIIQADIRSLPPALPPHSFDTVLANPPFRRPGTGRQAPVSERAVARHELAGGLDDFLKAAVSLLKDGGRFYIVYLAERLAELLAAMQQARLEPKRLRCVHARAGEGARMVLVEGRKAARPGLQVEAPLFVYAGDGYSAEVREMYGEEISGFSAPDRAGPGG